MSSKSLPAYLRQVLEEHVAHADLSHDDELESIYSNLAKLHDSVEKVKLRALEKRASRVE